MRRGLALTTLLLALPLLAGCGATGQTEIPDAQTAPTSIATTEEPEPAQPSPTTSTLDLSGLDDAPMETLEAPAPQTEDAATDEDAAAAAGHALIEAYFSPTDYNQWWLSLEDKFTESAADVYSHTDPATVSPLHVTGPATAELIASGYLAEATVPTDGGTFTVLLVRDAAGAPWLAERITFPEGETAG